MMAGSYALWWIVARELVEGAQPLLLKFMLWMLLKLIFLLARKKSHYLALSMVHLKALPFKLRPWTIREMHCTVDYWTDHKESLTQRPG